MLSELLNEEADLEIKHLDNSRVEGDQDPGLGVMEAQAFDPFALSFKLVDKLHIYFLKGIIIKCRRKQWEPSIIIVRALS